VTRAFAEAISHEQANTVLDVGCGTGILALVASRFAESVVGIDIDPQAVECSRYNAALNRVDTMEFLQGHALEPVEGRQFDLIVCNPPFYPAFNIKEAPMSICLLGNTQGELLYALIAGISKHLSHDGKCLFVTSSLSDNHLVSERLVNRDLLFGMRLLSQGKNQDILLWDVHIR
jgi:methylase of polypeptide subunit release factors